MGRLCPDIGVSSGECSGAVAPRCLSRESTASSEGPPCGPCTSHHWCDGGSDQGERAARPIVRWCGALVRREGAADTWSRVYGPRVLSHADLDLRTPAVAYGDAAVTLSCGPSRPVASWLREGMEHAESIRSLARSYRAVYSPARAAVGLHASDMDHSSAYAPDDARWASGASRTIRVRTPEGVQRTTVTGADVPSTTPVWRAPSHGRIAARRVAAKHGAALSREIASGIASSDTFNRWMARYSRAVVAVRRAETGLSDRPCEACLAAARSRIVDALLARAWGHDLGELDPGALAAERERLAELHAADVARAERDAMGSARACRAAQERALLAWREACERAAREERPERPRPAVACVCSRGVTRTARKGRKGDRAAPVAIVDRGIIAPRKG